MSQRFFWCLIPVCCVVSALYRGPSTPYAASPEPRATFEYFGHYVIMAPDPIKELNRYGAQGWELIFVGESEKRPFDPTVPQSILTDQRLMIFKRRR